MVIRSADVVYKGSCKAMQPTCTLWGGKTGSVGSAGSAAPPSADLRVAGSPSYL